MNDLIQKLDSELTLPQGADSGRQFLETAQSYLQHISGTSVVGLLKDFFAVEDFEEKVAKSYKHPNGFFKILLHLGKNYEMRLHVWDSVDIDKSPHRHEFLYASMILTGELLDTHYHKGPAEAPNGELYHTYHRKGRAVGDASAGHTITYSGQSRLIEYETLHRKPFEVYTSDRLVMHSTAANELTSTLIVKGRYSGEDEFYELEPLQEGEREYDHLTAERVQSTVQDVISRL
jgi:hypothetical protein